MTNSNVLYKISEMIEATGFVDSILIDDLDIPTYVYQSENVHRLSSLILYKLYINYSYNNG